MNRYLQKIAFMMNKEAKIEIKPSHKGLLHKNLGEAKGKKLSIKELPVFNGFNLWGEKVTFNLLSLTIFLTVFQLDICLFLFNE